MQGVSTVTLETLQDGAVLGIDGYDLPAAPAGGLQHDRTARDERLLVRERQPAPRLQRRHGRCEPGRADECIDDHVHVLARHHVEHGGPPGRPARPTRRGGKRHGFVTQDRRAGAE